LKVEGGGAQAKKKSNSWGRRLQIRSKTRLGKGSKSSGKGLGAEGHLLSGGSNEKKTVKIMQRRSLVHWRGSDTKRRKPARKGDKTRVEKVAGASSGDGSVLSEVVLSLWLWTGRSPSPLRENGEMSG